MLDATNGLTDKAVTILLSVGFAYGVVKTTVNGLKEQMKKKADREVVEVHMEYIRAELKEIKKHLKGE